MTGKSPWFRKKEIRLTFHFGGFDPLSDLIFHIVCLIIAVAAASFLIYHSIPDYLPYLIVYIPLAIFSISVVLRRTQRSLRRYKENRQN